MFLLFILWLKERIVVIEILVGMLVKMLILLMFFLLRVNVLEKLILLIVL